MDEAGSYNLYIMVNNNPVDYWDFLGNGIKGAAKKLKDAKDDVDDALEHGKDPHNQKEYERLNKETEKSGWSLLNLCDIYN